MSEENSTTPEAPKPEKITYGRRDTDIQEGRVTLEDRRKWNKAWNKAILHATQENNVNRKSGRRG